MSENERKSMIKVRGGFSDRTGIAPCNTQMQIDEFDDRTRTLMGNQLFSICGIAFRCSNPQSFDYSFLHILKYPYNDTRRHLMSSDFCRALLSNVFALPVRRDPDLPYSWESVFEKITVVISTAPYNEVLDILWYTCSWISRYTTAEFSNEMYKAMNSLFEEEYVGYRFIAGEIVPITDKIESAEIEQACLIPFDGARTQLQKALGFLSDREHPDYKNCAKESISAVESVCKVLANDPKAELGKSLKSLIANGLNIHGSLKSAILALYGYASDEGGIRHAERETESTVTFEEAKFMMVTCSAIVNYLVAEYGKHGAGNA